MFVFQSRMEGVVSSVMAHTVQSDRRRSIRVASCITGLEVGGAETVLAELLERTSDDVDVRVFSLIDGGRIAERIAAMGIPVTGMHMTAHKPSVRAFVRLWWQLVRYRPQIVHTWLYHADLMGGVAARMAFVPHVIWHLHNSDLHPQRVGRMTRAVVWTCARLSHVVPEVILSCSEAGARVHAGLGYSAKRMRVLPNGVDTGRFAPSDQARRSVRAELGCPDDVPLIGLIARVDSQKDHRGFFQAVEAFFASGGDAHFLLAGRDVTPEHWQLGAWREQSMRPERITLLGPRSDVPRLMAAFDVATSSSLGEAFPLVVVEAMSCGTPVVATDVGDCRLIIDDTGVVVPPADPTALAGAWSEMLALPAEQRQALGQRARDRVMASYTIERFADAVWGLYRELAKR
jgi:glycosyltransferase involved in cell wall biosynthesis